MNNDNEDFFINLISGVVILVCLIGIMIVSTGCSSLVVLG